MRGTRRHAPLVRRCAAPVHYFGIAVLVHRFQINGPVGARHACPGGDAPPLPSVRYFGNDVLDVSTVARGRKELIEQDVDTERVRKAGGGRHPVEKKRLK
jgi:hypothetical protein